MHKICQKMLNMQKMCKKYAEYAEYAKTCKNMPKICNNICDAKNMQKICKKYAKNMPKYAKGLTNLQRVRYA